MNTGIFDMFRNSIFYYLALVGHGIKLYLLGVLHKLRHNHRILFAHLGGHLQEA